MAEARERREERTFAHALRSRKNPATYGLIIANVVIFVAMAIMARTVSEASEDYIVALVNFGAKVKALIDIGEYWRLVTPMFLHIGVIHIVINMYSLYYLGMEVERLYGTARFLVFYIVSGVGGCLGSYAAMNDGGLSAGASGAIFGLFGVLLSFSLFYRNQLPGLFREVFSIRQLMPVLILNLGITFMIPQIDKGGHIGGLVAGALLAAAVPYFKPERKREHPVWYVAAGLCVALVFVSFAFAFSHKPRTAAEIAEYLPSSSDAGIKRNLIDPYNTAEKVQVELVSGLSRALDKQAVAPTVAEHVLASVAQLRAARGVDARSKELLDRWAVLFERGAGMLAGDRSTLTGQAISDLTREFDALDADWETWFQAEGDKYGLTRTKSDSTPGSES